MIIKPKNFGQGSNPQIIKFLLLTGENSYKNLKVDGIDKTKNRLYLKPSTSKSIHNLNNDLNCNIRDIKLYYFSSDSN